MSACQAARDQVEVLLERDVDPAGLVLRVRALERHVAAGLGEAVVLLTGDLLELVLRVGERALGGDHRRGRRVARGLRLLHVGNGDQADLEALVGLVELARDGLERGLVGHQVVIGRQHREVGGGHAQDQVLFGRLVVDLGLRHLRVRGLDVHPVGPGQQVRAQVHRPGLGGRVERLLLLHHEQHRRGGRVVRVSHLGDEVLKPRRVIAGDAGGAVELRQIWPTRAWGFASRAAMRLASAWRITGSFFTASSKTPLRSLAFARPAQASRHAVNVIARVMSFPSVPGVALLDASVP